MRLPRKLSAYAMTAVVTLSLGACHLDAGAGIHEDGTATIAMEFHDQYGILGEQNISSCDDFANQVIAEMRNNPEFSELPGDEIDKALQQLNVSEVPSEGGLGCRISFVTPDSIIDGDKIKETDSTFILDMREGTNGEIPAEAQMLMDFVEVRIVVATPGNILKADGATIDGNRAIYENLEPIIANGIYVEGEKSGNADFTDLFAPANASHGVPIWAWIAIGLGIVALIAILVFFMVRKKEPEQTDMPFPGYGFTPHYDPGSVTRTPMPSEQPTIPTQNTSHTQPSAPATPSAQPIPPMQSHPGATEDHFTQSAPAPDTTPMPETGNLGEPTDDELR
ncbi:hypothetical protein [Arcanobacterium buesumense]|uniref:Uncharacterized protein n=1 Tax=Arcanobacterium buesumense TaxID=2722751 RepID=A0A6H2EJT7_9ACTO|nr:hypothetical protein [Arcanobacterium buesumense]QJC21233.1 hypothetical protein HC352_00980 [Arcanobacterium buesumense]